MDGSRPDRRLLVGATAALLLLAVWVRPPRVGDVHSNPRGSITTVQVSLGTRSGELSAATERASTASSGDEVNLAASRTASPSAPVHPSKRSGGAVIVYVIVLLAFGALYLFTRDRLRRR